RDVPLTTTPAATSAATLPSKPLDNESALLQQLGSIDTLKLDSALNRMKGRTKLYLSLVRGFSAEQQYCIKNLKTLFDQDEWETLYLTIHSLKSNSAYIGAQHLSQQCAIYEDALAHDNHDRQLLGNVCDALVPLLSQLRPIFESESNEKTAIVTFSITQLKQSLSQILPLLETSNIDVEDYLSPLKQMSEHCQYTPQLTKILELIDDIEYEEAVVLTNKLLDELALESQNNT
ncbi:MAG: Hpt domain-containing protein, partial [Algicola sp.]|nr:Hpt domain-containing protein [Algicola sp.]